MVHNKLMFGVTRPCVDCHITSFTPDLVYGDGTRATMDSGPMLHHMVLTSQWRPDATCAGSWLGLAGERFFASGNERTTIAFPAGYGYRVRYYDAWNLLVDLMNHATSAEGARSASTLVSTRQFASAGGDLHLRMRPLVQVQPGPSHQG